MRRLALPAALAVLALTLPSCGSGEQASPPGNDQASPGSVTILATVWPLQWLAESVAPGAAVHTIGGASQDPHGVDLSPAERELAERASLVVHLGELGFQPQVERALAERRGPVLAVDDVAGELLLPAGSETADDSETADGHGHGHDGASSVDPHVWLDPLALAATATALAERLAAIDPGHAEGYRDRARALANELARLHEDLDRLLSDCRRRLALVSHEAFAYLLRPRGLEQVGISGPGGHAEVSPARLAELSNLIHERGITAVLAEPVEGRDAAEALAREAGVALRDVDALEAPPTQQRALGYPELLRRQARVFSEALACGR